MKNAKKKTIVQVVNDPQNEVTVEVLAESILEISEGFKVNGVFEFKDIGRYKAVFAKVIEGEHQIISAVKPYLMSQDISWVYDEEKNEGHIFAGMRTVGSFSKLIAPANEEE